MSDSVGKIERIKSSLIYSMRLQVRKVRQRTNDYEKEMKWQLTPPWAEQPSTVPSANASNPGQLDCTPETVVLWPQTAGSEATDVMILKSAPWRGLRHDQCELGSEWGGVGQSRHLPHMQGCIFIGHKRRDKGSARRGNHLRRSSWDTERNQYMKGQQNPNVPLFSLPVGTYTWLLSPHVAPSLFDTTLLTVNNDPVPSVVSKTHSTLDGFLGKEVQPGIPSRPVVVPPETVIASDHEMPLLVEVRIRISWSIFEFPEA